MQQYRIISTNMKASPLDVEAATVSEALSVAASNGLVEAELLKDGEYQFSVRRLSPDCEYWIAASRKPSSARTKPHRLGGVFSLLWRNVEA